jgi:hypothetical protein
MTFIDLSELSRAHGAISSTFKHNRLDQAAEAAAQADRCLAVLRTELADVGETAATRYVSVEGLTRFVDVWFDNIFTDLAVRDHIKQAQGNGSPVVRRPPGPGWRRSPRPGTACWRRRFRTPARRRSGRRRRTARR